MHLKRRRRIRRRGFVVIFQLSKSLAAPVFSPPVTVTVTLSHSVKRSGEKMSLELSISTTLGKKDKTKKLEGNEKHVCYIISAHLRVCWPRPLEKYTPPPLPPTPQEGSVATVKHSSRQAGNLLPQNDEKDEEKMEI